MRRLGFEEPKYVLKGVRGLSQIAPPQGSYLIKAAGILILVIDHQNQNPSCLMIKTIAKEHRCHPISATTCLFWSLRPLMSLLLTWRKDIMAAETSLWLKKLWSQVTDVKMSDFTKWVSGGHFTVYPKPATAWGGNSSRQPGPKLSLELPVGETWHPALNGGQAHPRAELFVAPDLGVRGRPQSSKKKKLPGRKDKHEGRAYYRGTEFRYSPDNFCSQSLMELALLILGR